MAGKDRIVVLIDMDCFFCQVEEKLNPALKGKPVAVVQYNQWQGGGIIAVNYLARDKGVTRHMRGDEAKKKCPEIELPIVPCLRGKADTSKYRDAGKDVALVLQEFTPLLERASVDEAYLDITQLVESRMNNNKQIITTNKLLNTFVLGYENVDEFIKDVYGDFDLEHELSGFDQEHSLNLLHGAVVVSEIRAAVYEKTGFRCSAGISHNKILAKLVCGMNKPNKQTVLPKNSINQLYESLTVSKVKGLGGKFGEYVCSTLKITTMKELTNFNEKDLQKLFDEKNGLWLYNIARGIDNEPVTPRFNSKSIGCCKKFPGKTAITELKTLMHWLKELGSEIEDRLKNDCSENNRYPTQMVVSFTKFLNGKDSSCSRSINMDREGIFCNESLAANALLLIKKDCNPFCNTLVHKSPEGVDAVKITLINHIKFLGIAVGKFEENNGNETKKSMNIQQFFDQARSKALARKEQIGECSTSSAANSDNHSKEQPKISPTLQNTTKTTNKNTPQESFILNYLESFKKQSESPQKLITESKLDDKVEDGDNDSECSIELEINQSKRLHEETDDTKRNEIENLRSLLTHTQTENSPEKYNSPFKSNFIQCDQCNRKILEKDSIEHQDYHFALKIREEDRKINGAITKTLNTTIAPKIQSNQIKNKKIKIVNTHCKDILTLFNKINCDEPANEDEKYVTCDECGKSVQLKKLTEHTDFHAAKKLYEELRRSETQANAIANKRKRECTDVSDSLRNKSTSLNKIDSYFK